MATGTDRASLKQDLLDIESAVGTVTSAYFDTTTTKNASVTLVALDALGGPIDSIVIQFYLVLDAAATFTPAWYVNTIDAPLTFTIQNIPAISTIATPAANGVYRYEYPGILAQGMQLEFRIAQDNAGNASNVIEGDLSYRSF